MSANAALDLEPAARALCNRDGLEFRGLLGRGAFKSAYLAIDPAGRPLALKIAVIAGSPERLIREARALQECSHPSIAHFMAAFAYLHGTVQLWIVIEEYLAAGTLEQRLAQHGVLPLAEARSLALHLAGALEHLHPRRLVHRDVKPANIMFRDDGTPVLTDFGIVRMLDEPTLTRAFLAQGPGTPAYAAPEQLTNDKALIDWRTDQFGLAVVLAQAVSGHHPYQGAGMTLLEAVSQVAAHQDMPAANAEELRSLGWGCLVQALQSWPIARYRRPSQFIEVLRQI